MRPTNCWLTKYLPAKRLVLTDRHTHRCGLPGDMASLKESLYSQEDLTFGMVPLVFQKHFHWRILYLLTPYILKVIFPTSCFTFSSSNWQGNFNQDNQENTTSMRVQKLSTISGTLLDSLHLSVLKRFSERLDSEIGHAFVSVAPPFHPYAESCASPVAGPEPVAVSPFPGAVRTSIKEIKLGWSRAGVVVVLNKEKEIAPIRAMNAVPVFAFTFLSPSRVFPFRLRPNRLSHFRGLQLFSQFKLSLKN